MKTLVPAVIIGNAIIWGFVLIGCSMALKGTGMYQEIQNILHAGVVTSNMLVGLGVGLGYIKMKKKEAESINPDAD